MKRTAYLVITMMILICSAVSADDGYYGCGSESSAINGKEFENLTVDLTGCEGFAPENTAIFENLTVTGNVVIRNASHAEFRNSVLNSVSLECAPGNCRIGLTGKTKTGSLEISSAGTDRGTVTVYGLTDGTGVPGFYSRGYLCEGDPEFAAYSGMESEYDIRVKEIDVFSDMGYVGEAVVHTDGLSGISFENVWLHSLRIEGNDNSGSEDFIVSTKGMTYIDLLDSGGSFGLHNLNGRKFGNEIPFCSPIASDYARVGFMYLHSEGSLTVAMDNQYVDRLAFFGNGCENSTLYLTDYLDSGTVTEIGKAYIYDANAEFFVKQIGRTEFLIAPESLTPADFYDYFGLVKDAMRNCCEDLPEMKENSALCYKVSQYPEADSAYWDYADSAKVWARLSGYVQIPAYGSIREENIPYFFTKAAFLDEVKYSSAYGVPVDRIPGYITGKGWQSLNPTKNTDGTAGIAWNGGCSFNREMTVGAVTYKNCLEDLPDLAE